MCTRVFILIILFFRETFLIFSILINIMYIFLNTLFKIIFFYKVDHKQFLEKRAGTSTFSPQIRAGCQQDVVENTT